MSTSTISLTKGDFDQCNWQSTIISSPRKKCLDYAPRFFNKAAEAKASGDIKAHAVWTLMGNISFPILKLKSKNDPFERGDIFNEVSDEHLAVLAEIVSEVQDPEMRARIADLLWMRKTGNYMAVKLAIDAYLEIAHHIEDPEQWVEWVQRIERAFRLAASIDQKKKGPFPAVIAYVEDILERYQEDSGFLLAELMELLQEHRLGDPKKYLILAQQAVTCAEEKHNWHKVRTYLAIQAKWHAMELDNTAERSAKLALAETYVKEAEDTLKGPNPSYIAASEHLESAIHALRGVGGVPERVEQLHKQLLDYQGKSLKEYKRIEVPIDSNIVNPTLAWAKRQVTNKPLPVALFELAFIVPSPRIEDLRKQVEVIARAAPFQHLLASRLVNTLGKTTERSTPMLSGDADTQEVALREKMFAHARMLQGGHALLIVEPAREQINTEFNIRTQDLLPFVAHNPFVPPGHEEIYARGLAAGFAGDFLVATHLLIPQVENSLRHLLTQQGLFVSGLMSPQGIQDEYNLNKLFEEHWAEMAALLGEDLTFDLEGLLIERSGTNLRNEVSHGLLNADRFGPGQASYLWWLTLKLCIAFWLLTDDEEDQTNIQDSHEHTEDISGVAVQNVPESGKLPLADDKG